MKKLGLLATACLLGASLSVSQAQTSQGTLTFGGGLGFTSSSSKGSIKAGGTTTDFTGPSGSEFSIMPGVGYFVSDNLAVGLDLYFGSASDKEVDGDDYEKVSASMLGVTPYLRYYIMPTETFGFTATFGIGFASGSTKFENKTGGTTVTADGAKVSDLEIGIRPGIVFFPTENIGLEASFGFVGFASSTSTLKIDDNTETKVSGSTIGLNANSISPTFSLGFRYYLGN